MTVTTSITGQSIGTSTNVGTGLFAQKVTKQAATTAIVIAVRVTNGAAAYDRHAEVLRDFWPSDGRCEGAAVHPRTYAVGCA